MQPINMINQDIIHLGFKKQLFHFRKIKPDTKCWNRLTPSYCARERLSFWERLRRDFFKLLLTETLTASTLSRLPAKSGIFCHLVDVVYWPCGLEFVYTTINLALLGIIVKLNFQQNFACTVLNDFVSKSLVMQNIFFLACIRHCDQRLIVVIVCYFQIWNKKEHIIIRVIWSHIMCPIYIETPRIYYN